VRRGVRIGLDVGSRRVGVARSDPDATLALPVATVERGRQDDVRIAGLVGEYEAVEVVVGLPLGLDGREGAAAAAARAFAARVATVVAPVPVRLVDERLTTVTAQQALHAAGRDVRSSRAVVDQAAAVVIVEHALGLERAGGSPPGELVVPGATAQTQPEGGA
jgi:putative holliday junction resolvase